MQYHVSIAEGVYWIGANDRRTELFENLWPLPQGVSYNSYLITDEKTVLLDTIEAGSDAHYIDRIEALLDGKPLDYLVINHMEPDHSGEIGSVVRRWPQVEVVGNPKTFQIMDAYYGDMPMRRREVADGEEIVLGRRTLRFVYTPWVHWPETMMTYETSGKILFSGDAFGTFGTLDGGVFDDQTLFGFYESEMRRYYSNIVGKYSNMVQKALAKLRGVEIRTICSLHGPVWRSDPARVIGLYDRWSRYEAEDAVVLIYGSMYGNTAEMADYIANRIARAGVRNLRVYDVSKTHISYLINEIWRCRCVVLGSCAYNGEMFPPMENLTTALEHMNVKERSLALFGSYSWNGGGVKNLCKFSERIPWKLVCEPAEIKGCPTPEKYALCDGLAEAVAVEVLGHGSGSQPAGTPAADNSGAETTNK